MDLNFFDIVDLDLSFLETVDLDLTIAAFGFEDFKSRNPPPPICGLYMYVVIYQLFITEVLCSAYSAIVYMASHTSSEC